MQGNDGIRYPMLAGILLVGLGLIGCNNSTRPAQENSKHKKQVLNDTAEALALPDLVKRVKAEIMVIESYDEKGEKQGIGTGFMISDDGWAVTNYHVLKYAQRAKIVKNGRSFFVDDLTFVDPKNDLIVFKIDSSKANGLNLAEAPPQIGEKVIAIGNPLGLDISVSDGIVAALRDFGNFGSVIQITSPISPGSSGSPVFNEKGQVLGVATFQMSEGQNLNFAIPVNRVKDLLKKAQGGEAQKGVDSQYPFDDGMDFFDEKDYRRAAVAFEEAIREDAQDGEAHYYLALCLREMGDIKAVSEMERALALDTEIENGHYELGLTYKMLNMKKKAEESFQEELSRNPDHEASAINLAEYSFEQKDYEAALNLLKKYRTSSNNPDLLTLIGYVYYEMSEYGQAIFAFKDALLKDSKKIEASLGLASTFVRVENWSQGIRVMNEAMLLEPQNPMIHFLLGALKAGDGDYASARREKEILEKMEKEGRKLASDLDSLINRIERNRR